MKNLKAIWLVGAAAVAAALFVGANAPSNKPDSVKVEDWVALGDNAGFVLTTRKGDSIGAELWVRDHGMWVRGRVENPFVGMRLSR